MDMNYYRIMHFWILILSGLLSACVGQVIIEAPLNTAAVLGYDARFNFSADPNTDYVKWGYYEEGESLITMYTSISGIDSDYVGEIEVDENIEEHQYDLTVLSVQAVDAGKYFAGFLVANERAEPELVVLDQFECLPDPPGDLVQTGQEVNFECKVIYYGYKQPTLRWFDEDDIEVLPSYLDEDEATNTLTLSFNATADGTLDLYEYRCELNFQYQEGDAREPPTYVDHCTTHYRVEYRPDHIVISPDPSDGALNMDEGEHINCTANGNPDPEYTWYCSTGDIRTGSQLEMSGSLLQGGDVMNTCNCTALNNIGGAPSGWWMTVSFYAYEDTGSGSDGGTTQAGVIAAAVIIPLIIIGVAVAIGVYFLMKKRKEEKDPKSGYTDPSKPKTQPTAQQRPPPTQQRPPSGQQRPLSGQHPPPDVQPGVRTINPQSVQYGAQTRQGYPGKGSPGYADLGVKGLSGSVPGLNQSQESLQDNQFYPSVNRNPSGSQV